MPRYLLYLWVTYSWFRLPLAASFFTLASLTGSSNRYFRAFLSTLFVLPALPLYSLSVSPSLVANFFTLTQLTGSYNRYFRAFICTLLALLAALLCPYTRFASGPLTLGFAFLKQPVPSPGFAHRLFQPSLFPPFKPRLFPLTAPLDPCRAATSLTCLAVSSLCVLS